MASSEQATLHADSQRPDDCGCWNADADLPCWPCFRDGFNDQNPAEPAADDQQSIHNHINGGPD